MSWLCDTALGAERFFLCKNRVHSEYQSRFELINPNELSKTFPEIKEKLLRDIFLSNDTNFLNSIKAILASNEQRNAIFSELFFGGPVYRIAQLMDKGGISVKLPESVTIKAATNIVYYEQPNSVGTYVAIQGDDHNESFSYSISIINILRKGYNVLQLDARLLDKGHFNNFDDELFRTIKHYIPDLNIKGIQINAHGNSVEDENREDGHVVAIFADHPRYYTHHIINSFISHFAINEPIDIVLRSCHGGKVIEVLRDILPQGSKVFTLALKDESSYRTNERFASEPFEYQDHFIFLITYFGQLHLWCIYILVLLTPQRGSIWRRIQYNFKKV